MNNAVIKYGERIPQEVISLISYRYRVVTKAINKEFWDSQSETMHSLYVGSYGRCTAIKTSDIDILVELPGALFDHFNNLTGNSQSRLLQTVKKAVQTPYPRSDIRADGQVVKITFTDGMRFEVVPTFKNVYGTYTYPDTNNGGSWRSTNPKAEQIAMVEKNKSSNGLLYDTCKHIRYIRDNSFSSYYLSGIVIDSFVYSAIGNWRWLNSWESSNAVGSTFEQALLDNFYRYGINYGWSIHAPGSGDVVSTNSSCECLIKILKLMAEK